MIQTKELKTTKTPAKRVAESRTRHPETRREWYAATKDLRNKKQRDYRAKLAKLKRQSDRKKKEVRKTIVMASAVAP